MVGNKFKWNSYDDDNLVAAFDMSTRTPGGLMKNLAKTGAIYDGTINGTFVPANPLIRAKRTPCMDFGGVNNWIDASNPLSGLTNFSIIAWINVDGVNGIIWSRAGLNTWYVLPAGTSKIEFSVAGTGVYSNFTPSIVIGKTYMIAVTRDSTLAGKIYIDGKMSVAGTTGVTPIDVLMRIGAFGTGTYQMNGRLDNMLFYNVALTPAQIWAIYRSSIPRM